MFSDFCIPESFEKQKSIFPRFIPKHPTWLIKTFLLSKFLISIGFFEGKFRALIISIAVLAVYGSLIYTAFDFNQAVSWESHLFGALVGFTSAYTLSKYP